MTYLDLVNSILVRLREDPVGSVSQTDYSRLVGAFVNDAKRVVEDSWPWAILLRSCLITLTAGTATSYDLEDVIPQESGDQFNERARLYVEPATGEALVYSLTSGKERQIQVAGQSSEKIRRTVMTNASQSGQVEAIFIGVNLSAMSGKSKMRIFTVPRSSDAVETIQLFIINPQNNLTADTEELLVPYDPVIQLAYLYCLYERGEELGEMLTLTANKAEAALADAIMLETTTSEIPTLIAV